MKYIKQELIEEMLSQKADSDNGIDLNAYGNGLIAMYDKLNPIIEPEKENKKIEPNGLSI